MASVWVTAVALTFLLRGRRETCSVDEGGDGSCSRSRRVWLVRIGVVENPSAAKDEEIQFAHDCLDVPRGTRAWNT
jgi:hypothetical protein